MYQLEATNACMILTHSDSLHIALSAARHTGLPDNKVVLFDPVNHGARPNVQDLISEGLLSEASFAERTLAPGEAKNKLAFLSFSSGTTGKPKVDSPNAHYRLLSNTLLGSCDTPHRTHSQYHTDGSPQ